MTAFGHLLEPVACVCILTARLANGCTAIEGVELHKANPGVHLMVYATKSLPSLGTGLIWDVDTAEA